MKITRKIPGIIGVFLCLAAAAASARAATLQLNITISSPPATSITFTPTAPCTFTPPTAINCIEPMAAGAQMGTLVVNPNTWAGALTMSGTTALVVNGTAPSYTLNVGATAITAPTTIAITLTAAP